MCITCGCSDDANPRFTTLNNMQAGTRTGQTNADSHSPEASHHHHHHHHHSDTEGHHSVSVSVGVEHTHVLDDGTLIRHTHDHGHSEHGHFHPSDNMTAEGRTAASPTITTPSSTATLHATVHSTTVMVEQNLLAKNDSIAFQNRQHFKTRNILALNLVSSPGAGKTTLLTRTLHDLHSHLFFSVIEGDQETLNDAQRIRETGCPVVQVNTGTGCHLEAAMIQRGVQTLTPPMNSVLMIENVGNLVCPALFDLGEQAKVAILSVTEGEDKPIKYPHMFRASQVMILTKTDLLPYVSFDVNQCINYARQVNPYIKVFQLSATTGDGLNAWYDWIIDQHISIAARQA